MHEKSKVVIFSILHKNGKKLALIETSVLQNICTRLTTPALTSKCSRLSRVTLTDEGTKAI